MHRTFELLELTATGDASFEMVARPELSTPFGFLYGGSGIAACVEAAERVVGRPLMWITTQFLTNAHPGQTVTVDVDVPVAGRATSQVQVTARVDGNLMLSSLCAHTTRPAIDTQSFLSMPAVEPPDRCPRMVEPLDPSGDGTPSFFDALDRRIAGGTFDFTDEPQPGPFLLWTRLPGYTSGSPATLAFIADIVPLGVSLASGRPAGGTSLDNTLRMVNELETEWVLVEIVPEAFHRSIGHGSVRLWAQTGQLLAIAQQTCIIRTSHHSG